MTEEGDSKPAAQEVAKNRESKEKTKNRDLEESTSTRQAGRSRSPKGEKAVANDERILELKQQAVALKAAGDSAGAKEALEQARALEFEQVQVEDLNEPQRLKQFAVSKKKQGDSEAARQALKKATKLEEAASKKRTKNTGAVPTEPGAYASANAEPSSVAARTSSASQQPTNQENMDESIKKKSKAGLKKGPTQPGAFSAQHNEPQQSRSSKEPDHMAVNGSINDSHHSRAETNDASIKRRAKAGLKANSKPGAHPASAETPQNGKRSRATAQVEAATTDPTNIPVNFVQRSRESENPASVALTDSGEFKPGARAEKGLGQQNAKEHQNLKPGARPERGVGGKKNRKKRSNSPKNRKAHKWEIEAQANNPAVDLEAQEEEIELKPQDGGVSEEDIEIPSNAEPQWGEQQQQTRQQSQENLIVAELVTERSQGNVLVSAVQVDPDADNNKPIYQHKQFPKIAGAVVCLLLLVIIVVIVAVVAATSGGGDSSSQSNVQPSSPSATLAPTGVSPNWAIIEEIITPKLHDPEQLKDQRSPYYQALRWLVYEDRIDPSSERLLNRYLLATFQFATSQNTPWSSCGYEPNVDSLCNYEDADPKNGETETLVRNRWLSQADECDWAGVSCHGGSEGIKGIELSRFRMNGFLIPEIYLFEKLKDLKLSSNKGLRGPLPTTLGQISTLHKLRLSGCAFEGTLPEELCNAPVLEQIDVSENNMVGTIPSCLGNLSGLEELDLGKNDMTGTIPTELGQLSFLKDAEFDDNKFSGSVPSEMCAIPTLTKLVVTCEEGREGHVACDPACDCRCV